MRVSLLANVTEHECLIGVKECSFSVIISFIFKLEYYCPAHQGLRLLLPTFFLHWRIITASTVEAFGFNLSSL
jgi:hypothetical protein